MFVNKPSRRKAFSPPRQNSGSGENQQKLLSPAAALSEPASFETFVMSNNLQDRAKKEFKRQQPAVVKYYLVAYNILSALGWGYVLVYAIIHVLNLDGNSEEALPHYKRTAFSILSRYLSSIPMIKSSGILTEPLESQLPPALVPYYRRATTTYTRVGTQTAFVQSFAALEVLHTVFGLVRSPLVTTAMQISSRLFLVWGIAEQFDVARTNPLYTSMVVAWATTEVVRYPFYALGLLGIESKVLLWLRYTTFYVLYPIGAASEAFLIYATLPKSSPVPSFQSWLGGMWKPADYFRGAMFVIWWPALYLLYTYMMGQRRKVLGRRNGQTLGAKPSSRLKQQ